MTDSGPGLSAALVSGESFTAACACSALGKLALRAPGEQGARALALAGTLLAAHGRAVLTADDLEHGVRCVRAGAERPDVLSEALTAGSRKALASLLTLPHRSAPTLLPEVILTLSGYRHTILL